MPLSNDTSWRGCILIPDNLDNLSLVNARAMQVQISVVHSKNHRDRVVFAIATRAVVHSRVSFFGAASILFLFDDTRLLSPLISSNSRDRQQRDSQGDSRVRTKICNEILIITLTDVASSACAEDVGKFIFIRHPAVASEYLFLAFSRSNSALSHFSSLFP